LLDGHIRARPVTLPQLLRNIVWGVVQCYSTELFTVKKLQAAMRYAAERVSFFQDRLEHRVWSPDDELMTSSTSEVAMCCCDASSNSARKRAFSALTSTMRR